MRTRILKFRNLPFTFKRSIIIYNEENDTIDWTEFHDTINWVEDIDKVNIWIQDYAKAYGDLKFEIGEIDIEELKCKIMADGIFDFDTFEEYHKWYCNPSRYEEPDCPFEVFPIIVSDKEESYIEDGWHRFHNYVDKGIKNVPFIKYI